MIDWIMIVISTLMVVFFLVWWRWPEFRLHTEAPKYFVLQQERRFEDAVSRLTGTDSSKVREPTKLM